MGRQSSSNLLYLDCVLYDVGQVLYLLLVVMMSDVIACFLFLCFFFFPFHSLLHLFIYYFLLLLFLLLIILFNGCHEWMLSPCYQAQTTPSSCYHPIHAQATLSPATLYLHHAIQAQTTLSPATSSHIDTLTANQLAEAFGYAEKYGNGLILVHFT